MAKKPPTSKPKPAGEAASKPATKPPAAKSSQDKEIARLEAECAELKDKMMRALAEAENTRQRSEREIAAAHKYAHSGFVRDMTGVVENLTRAIAALPPDVDGLDAGVKNLVVGIKMVADDMGRVLAKHGITRINPTPMGEAFDPDRHQAMQEVETEAAAPGTVVAVAQAGWMLHDRLLLPAMVSVAKAPTSKSAEKGEIPPNKH